MNFKTEDVAKESGIALQTARNWLSSNYIPDVRLPGTGKTLMLDKFQAIQLIVAGELSHVGVGPKKFKIFIDQISHRVWHLFDVIEQKSVFDENNIEGQEFGIVKPGVVYSFEDYVNMNRYYIIYHNPNVEHSLSIVKSDTPVLNVDSPDVARIVIDTLELTYKVISIFLRIIGE